MVKITGEGSGRLMEKILRHHDAADVAEVGSECELSLKIPRKYTSRPSCTDFTSTLYK